LGTNLRYLDTDKGYENLSEIIFGISCTKAHTLEVLLGTRNISTVEPRPHSSWRCSRI